jgi:predicted nucleotidyltransferase
MREEILQKLKDIETTEQVKILYACESGSRAWGFASPDSDYDVRFIYTRPVNHYLSIYDKRDVIEIPVNEVLDINGWDIRKAMQLMRRSNAPLFEWLQSPIIYTKVDAFHNDINTLAPIYFSLRAGMHHYLSMTHRTLSQDLDKDEVKLKKYFYALRPILAAKWIMEKSEIPPMEFSKLRASIQHEKEINQLIDNLLEEKSKTVEKGLIKKIAPLNDFIAKVLSDGGQYVQNTQAEEKEEEPLNELFRKYTLK